MLRFMASSETAHGTIIIIMFSPDSSENGHENTAGIRRRKQKQQKQNSEN
jgi:hypothetical protein